MKHSEDCFWGGGTLGETKMVCKCQSDDLQAQLDAVTRERDEAVQQAEKLIASLEADLDAIRYHKPDCPAWKNHLCNCNTVEGRARVLEFKRNHDRRLAEALERERALREAMGKVRELLYCAEDAARREAAEIIDALNNS